MKFLFIIFSLSLFSADEICEDQVSLTLPDVSLNTSLIRRSQNRNNCQINNVSLSRAEVFVLVSLVAQIPYIIFNYNILQDTSPETTSAKCLLCKTEIDQVNEIMHVPNLINLISGPLYSGTMALSLFYSKMTGRKLLKKSTMGMLLGATSMASVFSSFSNFAAITKISTMLENIPFKHFTDYKFFVDLISRTKADIVMETIYAAYNRAVFHKVTDEIKDIHQRTNEVVNQFCANTTSSFEEEENQSLLNLN